MDLYFPTKAAVSDIQLMKMDLYFHNCNATNQPYKMIFNDLTEFCDISMKRGNTIHQDKIG
jgi:hypothetical protein